MSFESSRRAGADTPQAAIPRATADGAAAPAHPSAPPDAAPLSGFPEWAPGDPAGEVTPPSARAATREAGREAGRETRRDVVLDVGTGAPLDIVYGADDLSAAELDALPYGMIQLDSQGTVLRYSRAESRLSGRAAAAVVGRNFFHDVAPCTRVAEFLGRFEAGVAARRLDEVFAFRFAFDPPRDVRVHLFWSQVTRSVWVKVVDLAPLEGA